MWGGNGRLHKLSSAEPHMKSWSSQQWECWSPVPLSVCQTSAPVSNCEGITDCGQQKKCQTKAEIKLPCSFPRAKVNNRGRFNKHKLLYWMKRFQFRHVQGIKVNTQAWYKKKKEITHHLHIALENSHKIFRKGKSSSLYCPFKRLSSHVRQPCFHGVNSKKKIFGPSLLTFQNCIELISANTAIRF